MFKHDKNLTLHYFTKNMATAAGLVLIGRGIWYVFDALDLVIFGSNQLFSAVSSIVIGLLILYIPDGNLREIEKL